jgi:hypothetical protein
MSVLKAARKYAVGAPIINGLFFTDERKNHGMIPFHPEGMWRKVTVSGH